MEENDGVSVHVQRYEKQLPLDVLVFKGCSEAKNYLRRGGRDRAVPHTLSVLTYITGKATTLSYSAGSDLSVRVQVPELSFTGGRGSKKPKPDQQRCV
jgi:hypothetical protein